MDFEELNKIAGAADFERLIGQIENIYFDCKRQPYLVENDKGKREIAKDVSAFANAKGGFIFVGIETEAGEGYLGDKVVRIRALSSAQVNTQQYLDIAKSGIYPAPKDLRVDWVKLNDSENGIVVIRVPYQTETDRPFIIRKNFDESEKEIGFLFGYAERNIDQTDFLKIEDMQKLLHAGKYYEENLGRRLDTIEKQIIKISRVSPSSRTPQPGIIRKMVEPRQAGTETADLEAVRLDRPSRRQLSTKLDEILDLYAMKDRRLLTLKASPDSFDSTCEVKTIFTSQNDERGVRWKLAHPPVLRYAGWDIETGDTAKIIEGEYLELKNGDRKVIRLYREGTMILVASADADFLMWGNNYGEKQKINPLALIEVIYSFVRAYFEIVVPDLYPAPTHLAFEIGLRNTHLQDQKSKLAPHALNTAGQMFREKEAPKNNWMLGISIPVKDSSVDKVAYRIVQEAYHWFGFSDEEIPYSTKDEKGDGIIDTASIVKRD